MSATEAASAGSGAPTLAETNGSGPATAAVAAGAGAAMTARAAAGGLDAGMAARPARRADDQPSTGTSDAGSASPSTEPVAECTDGEVHCSTVSLGTVETCVAGQWSPQPCAAEEMCLDAADGARCVLPVDVCVGRDGENVCTDAGEMLTCLPGGEAMMIATCSDPALCKAGIASGQCAQCVPGTHQCNGADLETCDSEGQAFGVQESCASAALCNAQQGRCTAPKCEAEQSVCEGNALKRCNNDLTALETVRTCGPGLCDAENGACRMCMPGQARCSLGGRQECDAQGQAFTSAACPDSTPICYGSGECVQCMATSDCEERACHTASCSGRSCSYRRTPTTQTNCSYSDGTKVRPGGTTGEGKIYVIVAGAAFHIYTADDLNKNFGGLNNVVDIQGALNCGSQPSHGVNLRESDQQAIFHIDENGQARHIVHGNDFNTNCGGRVQIIPSGGFMRNNIRMGDAYR